MVNILSDSKFCNLVFILYQYSYYFLKSLSCPNILVQLKPPTSCMITLLCKQTWSKWCAMSFFHELNCSPSRFPLDGIKYGKLSCFCSWQLDARDQYWDCLWKVVHVAGEAYAALPWSSTSCQLENFWITVIQFTQLCFSLKFFLTSLACISKVTVKNFTQSCHNLGKVSVAYSRVSE